MATESVVGVVVSESVTVVDVAKDAWIALQLAHDPAFGDKTDVEADAAYAEHLRLSALAFVPVSSVEVVGVDEVECERGYAEALHRYEECIGSAAENAQRISVASYDAIYYRMLPNPQRKQRKEACVSRPLAVKDLADLDMVGRPLNVPYRDDMTGAEQVKEHKAAQKRLEVACQKRVLCWVAQGAAMRLLFGATGDRPIVLRDGTAVAKTSKRVGATPALPIGWINDLLPLVVREDEANEYSVERWTLLPYVEAEIKAFVGGMATDVKTPIAELNKQRDSIRLLSLERRAEKGDKKAQDALAKVRQAEKKVADAKAMAEASAKVDTAKSNQPVETKTIVPVTAVPSDVPSGRPTPIDVGADVENKAVVVPASDAKPVPTVVAKPAGSTAATSDEIGMQAWEFITEAAGKDTGKVVSAVVAMMEWMKDDDTLPEEFRRDCIAFLLARARRSTVPAKAAQSPDCPLPQHVKQEPIPEAVANAVHATVA